MAIFTEEGLRKRVSNQISKGFSGSLNQSLDFKAKAILKESVNEQRLFASSNKSYDIFLSHSSNDARLVAGLKLELEDLGYSVYVDWIEDPEMNRTDVSKETAQKLQLRMKQCKSLIYAFSENASNSKWMPWELGYFDGIKGTVAVLPISKTNKSSFKGTEYLGIYFYIDKQTLRNTDKTYLWVNEDAEKYILFDEWLKGYHPKVLN